MVCWWYLSLSLLGSFIQLSEWLNIRLETLSSCSVWSLTWELGMDIFSDLFFQLSLVPSESQVKECSELLEFTSCLKWDMSLYVPFACAPWIRLLRELGCKECVHQSIWDRFPLARWRRLDLSCHGTKILGTHVPALTSNGYWWLDGIALRRKRLDMETVCRWLLDRRVNMVGTICA